MTSGIVYRAPDYAKAVGIFLVVTGHVLRGLDNAGILIKTPFWQAVDDGIYLFHMPLFFYLAGLFFRQTIEGGSVQSVTRRYSEVLLLPLIVWSYIQFSLQFAAGGLSNNQVSVVDVLLAPFPPKQQFWFLGSLFVITVALAFALKGRGDKTALAIFGAFIIPYVFLWDIYDALLHDNYATFLFAQTMIHTPFFVMGVLLNAERMRSLNRHWLAGFAVFTGSIALYLFVPSGIIHGLSSVAAVLSLYAFMVDIDASRNRVEGPFSKAVAFVGMNSMIIYLSHVVFAAGVRSVLIKLGVTDLGLHLTAGLAAGMIFPLMLVPAGIVMRDRYPACAKAALPVRLERK